jgi:WLM domain
MSGLLVLGVLVALFADVVSLVHDPPMLAELKRRYKVIQEGLPQEDRWKLICTKDAIITGTAKGSGIVGSNVNKGYEIYICLDGDDIESAMYVFLHELAHLSVTEYDHSQKFWDNFRDLRTICYSLGVYKPVGEKQYCGEKVNDVTLLGTVSQSSKEQPPQVQ